MSNALKEQRDRFLAFAFASADMLLEVSYDGSILFATGAVQSLTGEKGEHLEGTNWLNLFSAYEQSRMLALQEDIPVGARCGPFLINMNRAKTDRKAVLTGIKMPYSRNFFITISLSNELMEEVAQPIHDEFDDSIYNKTQFIDAAAHVFNFARTTDKDADLTVFDFGRTETIPEENWADAMGEMAKYLREQSLDGKAVAEISDGRVSFIHGHDVDIQAVKAHMESIIKGKDPAGKDFAIDSQTIETGAEELSAEDAQKAFYHTINDLSEGKNISEDITTFFQSLKKLVTENQDKIGQLKSYIETVNFKFHYQPVARLGNLELHHYEMLCRFPEGDTENWMVFAQDAGQGTKLDLAVCERVGVQLTRKLGGSRTPYAMNVLPSSIEDPGFVEPFMALLDKEDKLHERLLIEITNAKTLKPSLAVKSFVTALKDRGYKITLDSLAANAKSITLLNETECDYVKLDGTYGDLVMRSEHERSMVRHLAKVCLDKKIRLIGKSIENKEQAKMLKSLNVEYGQGNYFGTPEPGPSYKAPDD